MYSKMLTTRHNTFIVPGSYTCIPSGYLYSPWIFVFLLSVGFFLAAFVYTFCAFSVLPWIYFSCLGSYKIPLVWQILSVRKCVKLVFKGEQIAEHLRTEATNSSWFQAEQSNNLSGNSTSNYLWSRTWSCLLITLSNTFIQLYSWRSKLFQKSINIIIARIRGTVL